MSGWVNFHTCQPEMDLSIVLRQFLAVSIRLFDGYWVRLNLMFGFLYEIGYWLGVGGLFGGGCLFGIGYFWVWVQVGVGVGICRSGLGC